MAKKPVFRSRPEQVIQDAIIPFMEARGWLVERLIGVAAQSGLPDLLCWHPKHGLRMVDVKNPVRHSYTKAQIQKWPDWEPYKLGVWIMFAASEEEYSRLFKPPNFRDYWKPRYDKHRVPIRDIMSELE